MLVVLALMPLMALAEGGEAKKNQNFVVKGLMWVKTLIDSMAVANVDRSYIEQPKKPWAVEVRTSAGQSSLSMTADWSVEGVMDGDVTAKTDNGFSTSLGAWIGYRGYGFGLSKELTGGDGSTLSFGAMGGSFGINLRIGSYHSRMPDVTSYFSDNEGVTRDVTRMELDDPIRVRSLFLVAYDGDQNWPLLLLMNNVGKIKFTQASAGAGYAYNWVPARGLLVSAQVMPMLTFYNRMYTYFYETVNQKGQTVYEWFYDDAEDDDEPLVWHANEVEERKTSNRVNWNFDARLSVSYNWRSSYLRLYGHYNRFNYKNDEGDGRLSDWTVYASYGLRF